MANGTKLHLFENEVLKTFLAQLKEGVVITTPKLDMPDPIILYVNEQLLQITGYEYDELIGQSPRVLQGEKTNRAMLAKLKHELQQGHSFTGETTNYRKDGTSYEVELTISPIFDEAGQIEFFIGIQRNITAQKEIHAVMKQAEKFQLETEAQKGLKKTLAEFAFALTQQLRDPLSVIRLNAESLQWYKTQLPEEKQNQKLAKIITEVDYLVELLNDVATISKINTSDDEIQRPTNPSNVDIYQVIGDIVRRTESLDWEYPPEIHLIPEGQFFPVKMDQHLLRHIAANLLSNAVKFSQPKSIVKLFMKQTSHNICIKVADNGDGIPEKLQAHLFDSFFRVPNSKNLIGTGLGLTIVKSSVDALKGTIAIDSTEGVGTTVEVNLPIEGSL